MTDTLTRRQVHDQLTAWGMEKMNWAMGVITNPGPLFNFEPSIPQADRDRITAETRAHAETQLTLGRGAITAATELFTE